MKFEAMNLIINLIKDQFKIFFHAFLHLSVSIIQYALMTHVVIDSQDGVLTYILFTTVLASNQSSDRSTNAFLTDLLTSP